MDNIEFLEKLEKIEIQQEHNIEFLKNTKKELSNQYEKLSIINDKLEKIVAEYNKPACSFFRVLWNSVLSVLTYK
jgi:hypothetical protein